MNSALLILVLLAVVASLGSWLFNQWFSEHRRASALSLGLGGLGMVLLLGVTAAAIVSTSAGWSAWVPRFGQAEAKRDATATAVPVANLGTAEHWPATTCIKPLHASGSVPRRWFLDNDCERPIVVMLAWCDEAQSVCTAGAPQAAWRYESAGLILTSAVAVPTLRRMPAHDAPITGTYALTEPPGGALRIRYLACYLGEAAVAGLTHDPMAHDPMAHDPMSSEEFERTLLADECYSRVSSASRVAALSGQPPVVSLPLR